LASARGTIDLWLGNVLDRRSCLGSTVNLVDVWDLPVLLMDDRGEGEGRDLIDSFEACLVTLRGIVITSFGRD
jgi:hypothetical protein